MLNNFYERVLLHEVAHLCAAAEVGSKSHDPHWARVFLELVYRQMGTKAWQALRQAFLDEGVELD
jgi:putative metallohydrolase (TIGR04338 family)